MNFKNWVGLAISRNVGDNTGKGCFGYKITKTGYTASLLPLPGVPKKACLPATVESSQVISSGKQNYQLSGQVLISFSPSGQEVGQNEPVFVDFSVINDSADFVRFDLGLDRKANFRVQVEEPDGRIVTEQLRSEGFGRIGEISLAPTEQYTQRLLLNEWQSFALIGIYRLKISVLSDFETAKGIVERTPAGELTISVGPRDADVLRKKCERLATVAISDSSVEHRMEAAMALSLVADPVGVPFLSSVLETGQLVEDYAAMGLARIGNSDAIAALKAAQSNPNIDVRLAASRALQIAGKESTPTNSPLD
ncbi:MAG TPA: HEAT repeat domain-containing protein [Terriglobales bacterium]|nr:HEAT repeat domain-containing protein [Terriglobales bacterium]